MFKKKIKHLLLILLNVQDQPFTVKNPKLDSNSALAKKRRAKGQQLPQLQVSTNTTWGKGPDGHSVCGGQGPDGLGVGNSQGPDGQGVGDGQRPDGQGVSVGLTVIRPRLIG